jgi:hypothetical protein
MTKLAYVFALTAFATPAFAQEPAGTVPAQPPKTLGVDGAFVVPLGDYGNYADFGGGALLRLEVPLATGGFITGRSGVIVFQVDERYAMGSLTLIPIYGGYRQPIGPSGAYVAGELGLTIGILSAETNTPFGNASGSDSDTDVGLTLSAGYRAGKLDLRAGLFTPNVDDFGLMATAGFDFVAL